MSKHIRDDKIYFNYIKKIKNEKINNLDFVYHFPVYAGEVNLARFIFFYEMYKRVKDLSGHIADIGIWKGGSFFSFIKFVSLFEKNSQTLVYGFDWFKGMKPGANDDFAGQGKYATSYKGLKNLLKIQGLDKIGNIQKMDLSCKFKPFLTKNKWMRFKLVFIDCGIEKVLINTLPHVWSRLVKGGILILDHYNAPFSPTESDIVEKYVGQNKIQQLSFVRQPTAFVVKKK